MRILFVVPYVPNLIRVRPFNLIRQLSALGHQVTVLTLTSNPAEQADAAALEEYCHHVVDLSLTRWRSLWNCVVALPTNKPLQSVYCWQPELADRLTGLVSGQNGEAPFDVVHVEHLRGARYGLHLNELYKKSVNRLPVVWDSVDCISELFRMAASQSRSTFSRWVTRFELQRTEQYEAWLLSQFSQILVTSPVDKQALSQLGAGDEQGAGINVLPNGVDLNYFKPDSAVDRDPATLVISGKMSYHANIAMVFRLVHDIMPQVWTQRPDARVVIVGKDPPKDIRQLADHPSIDVTGTVADIRPYIQRATIAVAPITYGAGIQNKVLEAMACATPVIADKKVTGSIQAESGRDFIVADDTQSYAEQILGLLTDSERRRRIGQNGREFVEMHHHWPTITKQLEEVYKKAIDQNTDYNTNHRLPVGKP